MFLLQTSSFRVAREVVCDESDSFTYFRISVRRGGLASVTASFSPSALPYCMEGTWMHSFCLDGTDDIDSCVWHEDGVHSGGVCIDTSLLLVLVVWARMG